MSADSSFRRFRFAVLQRVILPLAMPILRALVRSWRRRGPQPRVLEEMMHAPRVVLATCHGMLLHLLAYAGLGAVYGRRMVVMLSPSLDGRLLAATLQYFGIDHVYGTTESRGVVGAREFIRRVRDGDIGVIAIDGPLGPCFVAKRGALRIAAAADARLWLAVTTAGPGLRFGSWDRAHLPFPFARLELRLCLHAPSGDDVTTLEAVQRVLLDTARTMQSPVLPPSLRVHPTEADR